MTIAPLIPKAKNLSQTELQYRKKKIDKVYSFFPFFSEKSSLKSIISPKKIYQNIPPFKLNTAIHFSKYVNQNQESRIQYKIIINATINKTPL